MNIFQFAEDLFLPHSKKILAILPLNNYGNFSLKWHSTLTMICSLKWQCSVEVACSFAALPNPSL
jgi:hypothetical protein